MHFSNGYFPSFELNFKDVFVQSFKSGFVGAQALIIDYIVERIAVGTN